MILVFNCGSASLRWALFDKNLKKLAGERIEYPDFSKLEELTKKVIASQQSVILERSPASPVLDSEGRASARTRRAGRPKDGAIESQPQSRDSIAPSGLQSDVESRLDPKGFIIAHRVVHGGLEFQKPTKITNEVFAKLENLSQLAPLHNPPALKVIKTCRETLPNTPNIACFDTSFFANFPDYAKYYALPLELTKKYQIQRYGFHGISHEYITSEAAKQLDKPLEELQLITCHLGSGASITAIENGQPIDTSMGFTPLEGLMMATRSGNIDPTIAIFLQKQGLRLEEIEEIFNRKSGLLGISGFSSDMRDIIKVIKSDHGKEGEPSAEGKGLSSGNSSELSPGEFGAGKSPNPEQKIRAGLALQMYAYQVKKYIGAYAVALGGLDALVFTGAVAEGSELVRNMIIHGLPEVLGNFEILVIPANEELAIARKSSTRLL